MTIKLVKNQCFQKSSPIKFSKNLGRVAKLEKNISTIFSKYSNSFITNEWIELKLVLFDVFYMCKFINEKRISNTK